MDHRTKLEWARKHLDALDSAFGAFCDSQPYALISQYDPKERGYVARLKNVKPLPEDWRLIIGDIVHNMRSALDALTYQLACKNLSRPPTDDEVKQIQFVIVDDVKHWPGESGRRLRHLHPDAKAVIEGLQPYHRVDPTKRHGLSVLRDLSNVDKHRHILIALAGATSSGITVKAPGGPAKTVEGYVGPIEEGTVIARWNYVLDTGGPLPAFLHGEVDVRGHIGLDIQFANSWPAWSGSVMSFLSALQLFIRDTIFPPLEAHL